MASYGMNPVDLFEANDLFESGNLTQVQVSLLALAGMVSRRHQPLGWVSGLVPMGAQSASCPGSGTSVLPHRSSLAGQDERAAEQCGHRREVLGEAAEELR